MACTVTVYFLGQYRPAYFEADTLHDALESASKALLECDRDTRNVLYGYMIAAEMEMRKKNPPARLSLEQGARGLSVALDSSFDREFLARLSSGLTPCPGLDYSLSAA